MKNVHNILFDLDGTLTDSAPGIIHAYSCVAHKLKCKAPSPEAMKNFIGLPLRDNFATYVPKDKIERAVEQYFQCYDHMRVGLTENSVFDGVHDLLKVLKQSGKKLYLVTAKLEDFTLPILSHFGLECFFEKVYAASRDGNKASKEHLIANALVDSKLDPLHTVMIGDRGVDIMGAQANGLKSIGVTWGYGSEDELAKAKPDHLVHEPEELVALFKV